MQTPPRSGSVGSPNGSFHSVGSSRKTVPAAIPPHAQQDLTPRQPTFMRLELPISTSDSLPGRDITAVLGIVIGTTTRPSDMAHSPEMAYINTRARQDALKAMIDQARAIGADAVIGVRFDGGVVSPAVRELCAYGTAVVLRRLRPR